MTGETDPTVSKSEKVPLRYKLTVGALLALPPLAGVALELQPGQGLFEETQATESATARTVETTANAITGLALGAVVDELVIAAGILVVSLRRPQGDDIFLNVDRPQEPID